MVLGKSKRVHQSKFSKWEAHRNQVTLEKRIEVAFCKANADLVILGCRKNVDI